MMNKIKNVMKTKAGKVMIIGGLSFTLFGGGVVGASATIMMFDQEKASNIYQKVDEMGENLMTEKAQKWFYKDETADKQTTIDNLNGEITTLSDQITQLESDLADAQANGSTEQQATIDDLNAQISTLETEKATLESDLATVQSDLATSQKEVEKANDSIKAFERVTTEYETLYNDGQKTNGSASSSEWSDQTNGNDPDDIGNPDTAQ